MISLVASAIRPQFWMELYNSLKSNTVPFEVVFVGNKNPEFELPGNFRFIYSEVKPAQCFEIASRNASGDFLAVVSDDYEFSENALDKLYEKYCRVNRNEFRTLISCRYKLNGKVSDHALFYLWANPTTPPTEMCALWPMDVFRKFGGADRRFIALYWNMDLTMRFFETGGKLEYVEDAFANELDSRQNLPDSQRLHKGKWPKIDREFLDRLWMNGTDILSKRTLPFEPFDDKDILTISQSNRGDWK